MVSYHTILKYYQVGQDATKVRRIKPVKSLDEIKEGITLFLPKGNRFREVKVGGMSRAEISLQIISGVISKGCYNPSLKSLLYQEGEFNFIQQGSLEIDKIIIWKYQLEEGKVYRILSVGGLLRGLLSM